MSQPTTRAELRAKRATTQQQHPMRAAVRTALAALVAAATAAPLVVAILEEELTGWALLGVGGQVVVVASIVTRVMALPIVDRALELVGLGSAPEARRGYSAVRSERAMRQSRRQACKTSRMRSA